MRFSEIGLDNSLRRKAKETPKPELRAQLDADVEAFLAKGRRINVLPGTPERPAPRRASVAH